MTLQMPFVKEKFVRKHADNLEFGIGTTGTVYSFRYSPRCTYLLIL